MARRKTEVFSLSFLDVIACGFGAVVLFYTILSAQAGIRLPRTKPKVSVIGGLGGWVDVRTRQFTVTGRVEGCLLSIDACAGARLLASSRAIAGCIEIVGLAGGFGYYWVKPPDRDQFSLKFNVAANTRRADLGHRGSGRSHCARRTATR